MAKMRDDFRQRPMKHRFHELMIMAFRKDDVACRVRLPRQKSVCVNNRHGSRHSSRGVFGLSKEHFENQVLPAWDSVSHGHTCAEEKYEFFLLPRSLQSFQVACIDSARTDRNAIWLCSPLWTSTGSAGRTLANRHDMTLLTDHEGRTLDRRRQRGVRPIRRRTADLSPGKTVG